jgi:uncharacterized small protein (DUF1192 family)
MAEAKALEINGLKQQIETLKNQATASSQQKQESESSIQQAMTAMSIKAAENVSLIASLQQEIERVKVDTKRSEKEMTEANTRMINEKQA